MMTDPAVPAAGPDRSDQPTADRVLAVDLGGTFTKFGEVAEDGTLLAAQREPTPVDRGPDGLVEWLGGEVARRAASSGVRRFGVAVPGIVDECDGVVLSAANIGWYGVELASRLDRLCGLPGVVTHDVRAGGTAEWRCGAGIGVENLMYLSIGTGIAAAVVVDGRTLVAGGRAGEVGHLLVPAANGRLCACGQLGCLETVASGPGLQRLFADQADAGTGDAPSAEELARRARAGDGAALPSIELAALALTQALVVAITLYGTERVVVGGGLSGMFDLLEPRISAQLDSTLTFQRRPELVMAHHGAWAGLVGAGLTAWDRA